MCIRDRVMSGAQAEVRVGNCLPLENIPVGTQIHNIELLPGKGGQLVRSAGLSAQLMAKEGKYATLRLPSGEMRMVPIQCRATIGVIGNGDHNLVNIGKAGRKRHMGVRPTVRGSVMNPNDHPHGGGEGKAPVGRPGPVSYTHLASPRPLLTAFSLAHVTMPFEASTCVTAAPAAAAARVAPPVYAKRFNTFTSRPLFFAS